ncbi:MAG TPA: hypothetical protein VGD54_09550 [Steroidobacteraceae bacterium]
MRVASNELTTDRPPDAALAKAQSESRDTVEVLEELLAHSIRLRDMYRNARQQTTDIQARRLHELWQAHYKEQIRLVDVLIDRIHELNGAGRVFAGDFLHCTPFCLLLPNHASTTRLLAELVDGHDTVLCAATPSGINDGQLDRSWTRDFAVGQVVLVNDQQLLAVKEHLLHRGRSCAIVSSVITED